MLVSDLYCPSCRNAKDHKPQDNEICWSCVAMGGAGNYKQSKTHGDQIRAMTDEELAKLLDNARVSCGGVMGGRNCMADCRKCWLDWLKQEASDDNHDH